MDATYRLEAHDARNKYKIHTYIHSLHTYIHRKKYKIHTYIHSLHTYIHTYIRIESVSPLSRLIRGFRSKYH